MPTPQEDRTALLNLAASLTSGANAITAAEGATAEAARVKAAEDAEDVAQAASLAQAKAAEAAANKKFTDMVAAEAAEDKTQAAREASLLAEIAALKTQLAAASPTPAPTPAPTPTPTPGNVVLRGNKVFKASGEVIARGPEAVIASAGHAKDVDDIAATGANAMRMLLTLDAANNMTPAAFDAILTRAASHKMLVWVSLYTWNEGANNLIAPALGGGNFYNLPAPAGLSAGSRTNPANCYLAVWQRPWLKDLMNKHRSIVVIDAAQEYVGSSMDSAAGREA